MNILAATRAIDFTSPEVLAGFLATGIASVVGLLLTVFILKKILYRPLATVISQRQEEADASLSMHEQREQAMQEREADLAEAEQKQKEMLAQEREQAEQELEFAREDMMREAKASAAALLAEAQQKIEQNRLAEEDRLYQQAVDLAVATISRLEERKVSSDEVDALKASIRSGADQAKEAELET